MPRKKGTPKTGGRVKGKVNKKTAETRIWIQKIIDSNQKTLEADLKKLKPMERWTIIDRLLNYTLPKMQSVDANISIDGLSDEQFQDLVDKLIERVVE